MDNLNSDFASAQYDDFNYKSTIALDPQQYRPWLDRYEEDPSALQQAQPASVAFCETRQLSAKGLCDALVVSNALDNAVRGSLTLGWDTKLKRQRPEFSLKYPEKGPKELGSSLNGGQGGDLSFLPSQSPVISKQSCTYHGVHHGAKHERDQFFKVRRPG